MCNAITLPTRDVNTVDHRMYDPGRKMPTHILLMVQLNVHFMVISF